MKTILLIEDDGLVRESLQAWLEAAGFQTLGAVNGTQGIQLALSQVPDLILCDVQMPELDGYEVLKVLNQHPTVAMIPFIFLTGRDAREEMRRGMELGADDYLTKPCSPEELMRAIHSRLEKQTKVQSRSREELENLRNSITLSLPHEFRTPLTGILSGVELLQLIADDAEPDAILDIARNIQASTERLYRLVENYLLYAELQSREVESLPASRPIGYVTSSATAIAYSARHIAEKQNRLADLQLNLQDGAIAIPQSYLEKILEETLSNACKFSPLGTPIQIESGIDGATYCLRISDQGQGMTADQIARLGAYMQFERSFYEQQGLGLGIAIVQRLVHLYQGTIEIESLPGRQTTVVIRLPCWQGSDEDAPAGLG